MARSWVLVGVGAFGPADRTFEANVQRVLNDGEFSEDQCAFVVSFWNADGSVVYVGVRGPCEEVAKPRHMRRGAGDPRAPWCARQDSELRHEAEERPGRQARVTQSASSRTPNPVGPFTRYPSVASEACTPAMSRCAHG